MQKIFKLIIKILNLVDNSGLVENSSAGKNKKSATKHFKNLSDDNK